MKIFLKNNVKKNEKVKKTNLNHKNNLQKNDYKTGPELVGFNSKDIITFITQYCGNYQVFSGLGGIHQNSKIIDFELKENKNMMNILSLLWSERDTQVREKIFI